MESQHQVQRQTASYPGYALGEYPQRSRMDIEIAPPQRHMQATPVRCVSSENIPDRQQSEIFHQHQSMDITYTKDMHFTPHQRHMQGRQGLDQFSECQYPSTVHQPQMSHYQTSGMESTYPPTPQPSSPVTPPFSNTPDMPSFSSITNVDNLQVHLSAPSTPVTDPLYSDNSFTPEQKPIERDTPEVCKI